MKSVTLIFLAIALLLSCKKEKKDSLSADEITAKYGLTKGEYKPDIKFTKTFTTLQEFENFLKSRRVNVSDSVTVKSLNRATAAKSSNHGKIMDASGVDIEYGTNTLSSTFTFPGFASSGYPDKAIIFNFSPWQHVVAYSGANFGTFTYVPAEGKNIMIDEQHKYFDRYLGEYTEIYGVGGVFTYYENFHFVMDVKSFTGGRTAYAGYTQY